MFNISQIQVEYHTVLCKKHCTCRALLSTFVVQWICLSNLSSFHLSFSSRATGRAWTSYTVFDIEKYRAQNLHFRMHMLSNISKCIKNWYNSNFWGSFAAGSLQMLNTTGMKLKERWQLLGKGIPDLLLHQTLTKPLADSESLMPTILLVGS